jgi:transposase
VAAHQKKASRLGAVIVFWDESGYLMLPVVRSTWALRGQTPSLEHNARRQRRVSAIGMISVSPRRRRLGAYYLLQRENSIDETIVVGVLRQMRRHFRRPVIVLWDRLQAHRSAFVQDYVDRTPELHLEFFPPYAPELNPTEYLWGDTKTHDLVQFCPHDLDELFEQTNQALSSKSHDQQRLTTYIRQAKLPLRLRAA